MLKTIICTFFIVLLRDRLIDIGYLIALSVLSNLYKSSSKLIYKGIDVIKVKLSLIVLILY